MIGSLNKLLRNVASLQGKSAFEKSLIKATYSGDMKEPKEKHLIFILECMKGKHLELIRPKDALARLFDRFFNNLRSFSLMIKSLIILHRALQEEEISQMVAHKIKEKENLLYPYQKDDQSYETRMQCFICELYISYIKNLISFIIICQLFSISLKDLHRFTQSLQHQELFLIFSRIDMLIESILKVFQEKQYCQTHRILQSVIYLVFVDLLQIYQSYYLLITVMLEKFDAMSLKDAKRAFIIYLNFIKINKEIRKMAMSIISEFNIKIGIEFYDIDTKVIEALKISIETKEKENAGSKKIGGRAISGSTIEDESSDSQIRIALENLVSEQLIPQPKLEKMRTMSVKKIEKQGFYHQSAATHQEPESASNRIRIQESQTDHKPKLRGLMVPSDEYQGGQGVQRRHSDFGNTLYQEAGKDQAEEEKRERKISEDEKGTGSSSSGRGRGVTSKQRPKMYKSHTQKTLQHQQEHKQEDIIIQSSVSPQKSSNHPSPVKEVPKLLFPPKEMIVVEQATYQREEPDTKKLTIHLREMSLLSEDTLGMISNERQPDSYDEKDERDNIEMLAHLKEVNHYHKQGMGQDDICRSKTKEYQPQLLLPKQPILIKNSSSQSPRSKLKNHKVKFQDIDFIEDDAEEDDKGYITTKNHPDFQHLEDQQFYTAAAACEVHSHITPQTQPPIIERRSSNKFDDDLDEFKSIVVKEDQREDFFEALEESPTHYQFESVSPSKRIEGASQQPKAVISLEGLRSLQEDPRFALPKEIIEQFEKQYREIDESFQSCNE